jgi:hypothetical protein
MRQAKPPPKFLATPNLTSEVPTQAMMLRVVERQTNKETRGEKRTTDQTPWMSGIRGAEQKGASTRKRSYFVVPLASFLSSDGS